MSNCTLNIHNKLSVFDFKKVFIANCLSVSLNVATSLNPNIFECVNIFYCYALF